MTPMLCVAKGDFMAHPEEDYFRLGLKINPDLKLTMEEQMKIIKEEKEYLLQCEIEESE